jgi:phosphoribosyl-AMP cyclohydrolase
MDFGGALWLSCNKVNVAASGRPDRQGTRLISPSQDTSEQEQGTAFRPRFDATGLISAVVQDSHSGEVLMVAFMDAEALDATRATGLAHFHSRSRGRLWKKGESSGHVLQVDRILVDCDQDALVLKARPAGPTCHTGARSCFYRALDGEHLTRVDG